VPKDCAITANNQAMNPTLVLIQELQRQSNVIIVKVWDMYRRIVQHFDYLVVELVVDVTHVDNQDIWQGIALMREDRVSQWDVEDIFLGEDTECVAGTEEDLVPQLVINAVVCQIYRSSILDQLFMVSRTKSLCSGLSSTSYEMLCLWQARTH